MNKGVTPGSSSSVDGVSTVSESRTDASTVSRSGTDAHIPDGKESLGSVFILDNVLLPLLRHDRTSKKFRESNLRSSLHLTYAKKFVSRVCRFVEQQESRIHLSVPDLDQFDFESRKDADAEGDELSSSAHLSHETIKKIERAVSEWNVILNRSIEAELKEEPRNNTPMGEVDFWRRRHVVLSDIMEQLSKNPKIQKLLDALKASGSFHSQNIYDNMNVLVKLAVEAADNAKFLSTLERHLRTISDGTLLSMIKALPSLVDGMRMVWTVSRHYNRDERMVPLMERVGNQIASKVKTMIKLQDALKCQNLTAFKENVTESKEVLETWRTSYMTTRERIEDMGSGQRRWEFDRVLLFAKTDYMAQVCENLLEMIETINGFKQFFSSELLAITGENNNVHNIVPRVDSLMDIVVESQIEIFDLCNKAKWQSILHEFHEAANETEKSAESSIEKAFQQLRSSEKAYSLVLKLKGLKTRKAILEERYNDIIDRYEMELNEGISFFHKYKDNPPLCRRDHKTPGVIAWAHDIYLRTKSAIVLFQRHGDILDTKRGEQVKRKYIHFAREIETFKKERYEDWCDKVKELCQNELQRTLLIRESQTIQHKDASAPLLREAAHSDSPLCQVFDLLRTNFSNLLRIAILEAKHFDSIGYEIPEILIYLTLQQPIYDRHLMELEKVVKAYNSQYVSMSPIELTILKDQIEIMNNVLNPSLTYMNWSSQGVEGFVSKANNAIETLKSFLEEARKHSLGLEELVKTIESESFVDADFSYVHDGSSIDSLEKTADERGGMIARKLHSMAPLIQKVNMAISQANTGLSTLLFQKYYTYWEKRLYNAFVALMLRSFITSFLVLTTNVKVSSSEGEFSSHLSSNIKPFDATLFFRRISRVLLSSIGRCIRWKHESCAEATPKNNEGKVGFYSYRNDVSRDPSVFSVVTAMHDQCRRYNAMRR